jgi:hypothetical protein
LRERQKLVCKPCWELRYCPYGPVVEEFPLMPPLRPEAEKHNAYLRKCLKTGRMADGRAMDRTKRSDFKKMLSEYDPSDFPETIPPILEEMSCRVFGHLCPVYFVAEPFTETAELRRLGRSIPFPIRLRVARRDNYTCQGCGKHLKDDELEFDHLIPISLGGSSDEHNLRLTCIECNRKKSDNFVPGPRWFDRPPEPSPSRRSQRRRKP